MNILVYTPNFLPKIGGLENTVAAVVQSYFNNGHQVKIITYTPLESEHEITTDYKIYRNPSFLIFLKLFKWCDVVHYPNISLKGVWPMLFYKRTFCVSHHTTNYNRDGSINLLGKLKYLVASYAHNTSCSAYTNSLLYKKGKVIHSPYNEKQFYIIPNAIRSKELVFLGRLVSDKGCQLILEALKELKKENIKPRLSIIGDGPERLVLQKTCIKYDLIEQVMFLGSITGTVLNEKLNEHQILIVPSIWEEPFGKVALEGLAAGCKVIVSKSGGLPEAVEGFGIIFKKNDSRDLANKIKQAFSLPYPCSNIEELNLHLKKYTASFIGKKYTKWIENAHLNYV